MRLFRRWAVSFVILGLVYLGMEVFARAIRGEMVGFRDLEWASLAGWSSIWMFPIGGTCAIVIGALNEFHTFMKVWLQCLIGTATIFLVEFGTGCIFNLWLEWGLWDYSDWPLNILGQVTLLYVPVWFLVCPAAIWMDDILRLGVGQLGPEDGLVYLYKDLFTGK